MHHAQSRGHRKVWHLNGRDVDAVRPKLAVEAVHHNLVCYPRLHRHLRSKPTTYLPHLPVPAPSSPDNLDQNTPRTHALRLQRVVTGCQVGNKVAWGAQ